MKNLLNLYTEELRERPIPYGFSVLISAFLAAIALVLVLGAWTEQRLTGMEDEQRHLVEEQQALNQSIAALEAQRPKKEHIEAIERENARLTEAIAQRERLLKMLGGYVVQPSLGFSSALRGLSAAHRQGMWLTHIHLARPIMALEDKGKASVPIEVVLRGRMYKGQQLAGYLDALAATEVFGGLHFNTMQAQLDEKEKKDTGGVYSLEGKSISFVLSTTNAVK